MATMSPTPVPGMPPLPCEGEGRGEGEGWREPDWVDVDSTCLARVRVVPRGPTVCEFQVEFYSGRRYRYRSAPYGLIADFFLAPSKGVFFNREIRDTFPSSPM